MSKFEGKDGYKPSTQARRYVYECLAVMLEAELPDRSNKWIFGEGLYEFDVRRVVDATKKVIVELRRKTRGGR